MYPRGREALLVDPIVVQALQQVAKEGWEQEARQHARVALAALSDRQPAAEGRNERSAATATRSGGTAAAVAEHVMLSYNWGHQSVIKRVNRALQRLGYVVWIDIEKMQGSIVEVMAAAVEGAAVMVYGVSRAYKESANCRLEAQYAFQQRKEMVPLMLEEGYQANGWLGMLLGVRLYYVFYGPVLANEAVFESKIEELCRELGDKGKASSSSLAAVEAPILSKEVTEVSAAPTRQRQHPWATTRKLALVAWQALQACGTGTLLVLLIRRMLLVWRRRRTP